MNPLPVINPVANTKSVISANRLSDGVVVFLGRGSGTWVENLQQARLFAHAEEAEHNLSRARQDEAANLVVDCYAFVVKSEGAKITPATLRDSIRAAGPTVAWRGSPSDDRILPA